MRQIFILVTLMVFTNVHCAEVWEIMENNGNSLNCSNLLKLENDSLITDTLGKVQLFHINDISSITHYKKNVNLALISGGVIGGVIGLIVGDNNSTQKLNEIGGNRVTSIILGSSVGTLIAQTLMRNKPISLSELSFKEKITTIQGLIASK